MYTVQHHSHCMFILYKLTLFKQFFRIPWQCQLLWNFLCWPLQFWLASWAPGLTWVTSTWSRQTGQWWQSVSQSWEWVLCSSPPEGTQSPDLACMMTRCGWETFSCLTDRDCLKTIACLVPCGDDQACTFQCTTNYENEIFHRLTACNIYKAGCIKLKGNKLTDNPPILSYNTRH